MVKRQRSIDDKSQHLLRRNIAICFSNSTIDAWIYSAVEQFLHSTNCRVFWIQVDRSIQAANRKKRKISIAYYFVRLLDRVDNLLFSKRIKNSAFSKRDLVDLAPHGDPSSTDPDNDYVFQAAGAIQMSDRLRDCSIDLIINIDIEIDTSIRQSAGYGEVGFHNLRTEREGWPIGMYESLYRVPTTVCSVTHVPNRDGGAYAIVSASITTSALSPLENRDFLCWSASSLLAIATKRVFLLAVNDTDSTYKENLESNLETGKIPEKIGILRGIWSPFHFLKKLAVARIRHEFFWEQWVLLFGSKATGSKFEQIALPDDEFWADPWLHQRDGKSFLFFEVYSSEKKKGHISVSEIDESGEISNPKVVLEKPYHLSYPGIISDGQRLFMVPESKANNSIEIYECVEFPSNWEFRMNLMSDVRAVDATIYRKDDYWWMFVAMSTAPFGMVREQLHLFYSKDLLSDEWTAHKMNPVCTDVRMARPAGALFERDGMTIRPAQDCSSRYGLGVVFMRIEELSTSRYKESKVDSIYSDNIAGMFGVHSFAQTESITVIDGLRRGRRPDSLRGG